MNLKFPVVLVQEDDKWWASVPDIPGVYGLGTTEQEAKADIISALELYLEDIREDGQPLPTSHVKKVETDFIQVAA